jgi:O-antigen/teichoic acid export membrane protein
LALVDRLRPLLGGGAGGKGLARGAGVAFLLQGCGAGLAFAMQVLLGRWMGASDYGTYSFTVAWAGLVAVAIGLGLPTTVLRFIPTFVSRAEWSHLRGILRASVAITAAAGFGTAAVATLVVVLLGAGSGGVSWVVILGFWLVPLLALRTLQQENVRAFRRIALAYGPPFVLRAGLVIAGGAIWMAAHGGLTSEGALLITAIATVLALAFQTVLFWRGLEPQVRSATPTYETRAWMKVALPLLLIASFTVVLSETDIVMVGAFLGSREAGIYAAASKTSSVIGLVLLSVNAIAAPMFSSLFAQDRHEDLAKLATRVAQWIFWPTLVVSILLAVAAGPILSLFGSEFDSANWILIVLLGGGLVSAAAGSVGYLLTLTGHQREAAWVIGWVAVLHVALNAVMIPLFGAIGAAIATTTSLSVWNTWLHTLVVRRLDIHPSVFARFRYRT